MIKFLIIFFLALSLIPLSPYVYSEYLKWDFKNPADDESTINMFLDAVTPTIATPLVKQAQDINSAVVIIDMRNEEEFEKEHAKNAILIPQSNLLAEIEKSVPQKDIAIYVYSWNDKNAAVAVRLLRDMGYEKSFVMEGGLKSWKNAGYPTEEYYY